MLDELLEEYEGCAFTRNINAMLIHVDNLTPNIENGIKFNKILKACRKEIPYIITRTRSGGICKKRSKCRLPMYDYITTNNGAEITIIGWNGKMYRIQFRALRKPDECEEVISGHKAFIKFKSHLLKHDIDLDKYAIEDGAKRKETYIKNNHGKMYMIFAPVAIHGKTFTNVHHLDFHSSFPAGLVNTHPEFYNAINELYLKRKKDPMCKAILNLAIGYFHTPAIGCKFANLAIDAIDDNNKRILNMIKKLEVSGRKVLALNTDGIWYQGKIYHDENEGPNLGQWANDHVNCQWRCKSSGCYEFIENGKYTPIMRGQSTLDREKPREQWVWGDIFNTDIITFRVTENGVEYGI